MDSPRTAAHSALSGIYTILLLAFVLAALALADAILIPVALAALLTFLVSPLVTRLERLVGRIAAVLMVVFLVLCVAGATGWMVSRQLMDLGAKLPDYKGNIQVKLRSFRLPEGGAFSRLSNMIEELKQDILPEEAASSPAEEPVVVKTPDIPPARRPLEIAKKLIAPVIGPLGTAGLVLLLLVFMLLQREDLRSRLIRLVGKGRISYTTRAMDDAGKRVSRFLLMQLVVNVSYGIAVGIGLSILGIPSALLWATLATVLRFIPYVGPWIAATMPILLSLAVFDNWTAPLMTIGLFVVLELLSNNVMEPLLYGSSTGVSPTALIVAAVFWTWLWGPMGLVLSTPLTVCLVVIGRHVPRVNFLSILLSDERALTADEEFYHRLLAQNSIEAAELVDGYLKKNSAAVLYDNILVPVITRAEMDEREDAIDEDHHQVLLQSVRDVVDDIGDSTTAVALPNETGFRLAALPARAERDEVAATMLAQLLRLNGLAIEVASAELTPGELVEWAVKRAPNVVCVSVVPPTTLTHARFLCNKLRTRLPEGTILVGFWGGADNPDEAERRLRASGADEVVMSLVAAVAKLRRLAGLPAEEAGENDEAPGAADEPVPKSMPTSI